MTNTQENSLIVSSFESSMKLLRFLERHLPPDTPLSVLHRWIRSGQIRVNKKRSKPNQVLVEKDIVRLPPFAPLVHFQKNELLEKSICTDQALLGEDLRIVAETEDILILNKPSGMAVHPGSKITESVITRLKKVFLGRDYLPAPAHRLDKATSGLLLIGKNHTTLRRLHSWFASGKIQKEYLAWGLGKWGEKNLTELYDILGKGQLSDGREGIIVVSEEESGSAIANKIAISKISVVGEKHIKKFFHPLYCKNDTASLFRIQLVTGKKHQIRVQLSSRGVPIIGDAKYGGVHYFPMLLHAYRLTLPDGKSYTCFPDWDNPFAIEEKHKRFLIQQAV